MPMLIDDHDKSTINKFSVLLIKKMDLDLWELFITKANPSSRELYYGVEASTGRLECKHFRVNGCPKFYVIPISGYHHLDVVLSFHHLVFLSFILLFFFLICSL